MRSGGGRGGAEGARGRMRQAAAATRAVVAMATAAAAVPAAHLAAGTRQTYTGHMTALESVAMALRQCRSLAAARRTTASAAAATATAAAAMRRRIAQSPSLSARMHGACCRCGPDDMCMRRQSIYIMAAELSIDGSAQQRGCAARELRYLNRSVVSAVCSGNLEQYAGLRTLHCSA
ncbi:hypothetical protein JKP88DRAFT_202085 [Tribonema minus]|uniref:Uncharacterized protein n=1 Tax=Tribonema minus TaxID=303371 RepID=A0A835YND1_9STRA|nr:hypothetical protein JKP88DRAFT_202085 [Tribonema minus]